MSSFLAFVPFLIFLAIFVIVARRIGRIASMVLQPGAFKASYTANLNDELRKAGVDPNTVDLEALRPKRGKPASVPPELQKAVAKAFMRTLGLGRLELEMPTPNEVSLGPSAPASRDSAAMPVMLGGGEAYSSGDETFRPPAIDARSKLRSKASAALLLVLLAAGFIWLLRHAA